MGRAQNDFGLLRLQAPNKGQRSGIILLVFRCCRTLFHSGDFNVTELILQQLTNRPEKCFLLAVFAQSLTDSAGAAAGRLLRKDVPGFLLHGVVHGEDKVDAVLCCVIHEAVSRSSRSLAACA